MYINGTAIRWRMIDDNQIVLLDTQSGRYFTFNASASFVWNELMGLRSPEDIALKIANSCKLECDKVLSDVQEFVKHCMNEGLIFETDKITPIERDVAVFSLQCYEPPAMLAHETVQELTAGTWDGGHYWYP